MQSGYEIIIRKVIENGRVIFPEAFCLTEIDRLEALKEGKKLESVERLRTTNKGKFWSQYLNDPMDDSLLEFKREWFQKFHITPGSPISAEFAQAPVLISVDPAFTLRKTSDFTGIVVSKCLSDNNVYILEAKGIKGNPDMVVKEIMNSANQYMKVDRILIEAQSSQMMLMDLLSAEMKRQNKFYVINEVRPDNNEIKTMRIRGLIPHYSNRRIFHSENMWELEEQLMEFPKGQHDDIIDALAYQVKYWTPFHIGTSPQTIPEGSYEYWRRKIPRGIRLGGKLFEDFRR